MCWQEDWRRTGIRNGWGNVLLETFFYQQAGDDDVGFKSKRIGRFQNSTLFMVTEHCSVYRCFSYNFFGIIYLCFLFAATKAISSVCISLVNGNKGMPIFMWYNYIYKTCSKSISVFQLGLEYSDCHAKRDDHSLKLDALQLMIKLQIWWSGECGVFFIAITPKSSVYRSGSTC